MMPLYKIHSEVYLVADNNTIISATVAKVKMIPNPTGGYDWWYQLFAEPALKIEDDLLPSFDAAAKKIIGS